MVFVGSTWWFVRGCLILVAVFLLVLIEICFLWVCLVVAMFTIDCCGMGADCVCFCFRVVGCACWGVCALSCLW